MAPAVIIPTIIEASPARCEAHVIVLCAYHELVSTIAPAEDPHFLARAEARYRAYLKQLANAIDQDSGLALHVPLPPLDVAMFWAAHMLNPEKYNIFVKRAFGGTLLPIEFPLERMAAHILANNEDEASVHFWETATGMPYAPEGDARLVCEHLLAMDMGLDLVAAVLRQRDFNGKMHTMAKVLGTGMLARRAAIRYPKFLTVLAHNREALLVPTMDLDLGWHTHQLHPKAYAELTTQMLGYMLDHNDAIEDEVLEPNFETTAELWAALFNEQYAHSLPSKKPIQLLAQASCGTGCCGGRCGSPPDEIYKDADLMLSRASCGNGCCGGGRCPERPEPEQDIAALATQTAGCGSGGCGAGRCGGDAIDLDVAAQLLSRASCGNGCCGGGRCPERPEPEQYAIDADTVAKLLARASCGNGCCGGGRCASPEPENYAEINPIARAGCGGGGCAPGQCA